MDREDTPRSATIQPQQPPAQPDAERAAVAALARLLKHLSDAARRRVGAGEKEVQP